MNNPKEDITSYIFWDCPKLEFILFYFILLGTQKCPSQKKTI
jgi:hypothetical protein